MRPEQDSATEGRPSMLGLIYLYRWSMDAKRYSRQMPCKYNANADVCWLLTAWAIQPLLHANELPSTQSDFYVTKNIQVFEPDSTRPFGGYQNCDPLSQPDPKVNPAYGQLLTD
jgi:hypothetical protein